MAERINWAEMPFVEVRIEEPICPKCYWHEWEHVRSMGDNGDGTSTERVVCTACSQPYQITKRKTLPEPGNIVWPLPYDSDGDD